MNLQQKTIQRYRQLFPQETLKEVSARTGIQITRVFRLFTGKTMKVREYEAFETAIAARLALSPHHAGLTETLLQASSVLTDHELARVAEYVRRKVANKAYGRLYANPDIHQSNIA